MDKKEYKYQWSSKADNGEIMVIRNDDREELFLDIEWYKSKGRAEKPLESHPERAESTLPTPSGDPKWMEARDDEELNEKYAGKTIDELPGEDVCLIHNVKMFGKEGKYGKFYTHGEKQADGTWKNCNGKGWK